MIVNQIGILITYHTTVKCNSIKVVKWFLKWSEQFSPKRVTKELNDAFMQMIHYNTVLIGQNYAAFLAGKKIADCETAFSNGNKTLGHPVQ